MIRHVLIGLFAAVVAIVIVAVARSHDQPPLSLGPPVVKIDDLESFLPRPRPQPPATRPANPLDRVVPEVRFDQIALADAIEFLRDLTRANFLVNWRALEAAGIERTAPVSLQLRDVPASTVLKAILESAGGDGVPLAFRQRANIVFISTHDHLDAETEIRLYNVRDLMIEALRFSRSFAHAATAAHPPQTVPASSPGDGPPWTEEALSASLTDLIQHTTSPDSWANNGGRTGFIHYWAGKLLIVQTPEAHEEIEKFLQMLREQ